MTKSTRQKGAANSTVTPVQADAIELHRKAVISSVLGLQSIAGCWKHWKPQLQEIAGTPPSASGILNIGQHLSKIFRSTRRSGGRSQRAVAAGGAAWEGLVCWYLNLCLVGSRAIVVRKGSELPERVRQALSVKVHTVRGNTESDLVAMTILGDWPVPCMNGGLPTTPQKALSNYAEAHFGDFRVTVVQCKTNWNDNAQVPMLWNMIYQAQFSDESKIVVGEKQAHFQRGNLRYAFVTVPTSKGPFKSTSLHVQRVSGLSGGVYWGAESQSGIAESLTDFFAGAHVGPDRGKAVRATLEGQVATLSSTFSYFNLW